MDFKKLSTEDRIGILRFYEFIKEVGSHANTGDSALQLDDTKKKKLIEIVTGISLSALIELTIENEQANELCKNAALDDLWDERWRLSGRNPPEKAKKNNQPVHEYWPQPTVPTFQLLQGIFLYSQYKSGGDSAMSHLYKAAEVGYFPALNVLTKACLSQTELRYKALDYAQKAATLYWAPGYLLLTVTYFKLKQYDKALLHLIITEKLLPYSEVMINNAYQGKSFTKILEPVLLSLGTNSWVEAKKYLATLANLPLIFVTSQLYAQANTIIEPIKTIMTSKKESFAPQSPEEGVKDDVFSHGF